MLFNCRVGEDSCKFLGLQEIKPVHPKGNQTWIFIGRTTAEAETPIFWPPDEKNWLIGKDPGTGQDWRQKRRGPWKMRYLDLSPTWWAWIWASWWWTGKCGILHSMGSQRVGHDWATELTEAETRIYAHSAFELRCQFLQRTFLSWCTWCTKK